MAEPDEASLLARSISIVHELAGADDRFCNEHFQRAHDALEAAQRIYFLGFGFHPDNVRRFRFFSESEAHQREIVGTASGYSRLAYDSLLKSVREAGIERRMLHACSCNDFFGHHASLE